MAECLTTTERTLGSQGEAEGIFRRLNANPGKSEVALPESSWTVGISSKFQLTAFISCSKRLGPPFQRYLTVMVPKKWAVVKLSGEPWRASVHTAGFCLSIFEGWRDGSMAKSTWSCKGPGFGSQYPRQLANTSDSSSWGAHIHAGENTHIHSLEKGALKEDSLVSGVHKTVHNHL